MKDKSMKLMTFTFLILMTNSCNFQGRDINNNMPNDNVETDSDSQIGEYVVSTYEDSNGNLWFGTLSKGIARYDGTQLRYFTQEDGLPSDRVTSVIEDKNGVYWFSTGEGLAKYDGLKFKNLKVKENDWASNTVNQLYIDSGDQFWIGTWGGVYRFDGYTFTYFDIPYPEVDTAINPDTKDWVTEIDEDSEGNLWFARDGYGACRYDGESFVYVLKTDGLHSNNVTEIEFDADGSIWFGSRVAERDNPDPEKRNGKGGINKLIDNKMITFPEIKGFNDGDVYAIYKENEGNIWISTTKNGLYNYDGNDFTHFPVPISIMSILRDSQGTLWLAGAGGLYKINKRDEIVNVTVTGPWE